MEVAQTIQFLRDSWKRIGENKPMHDAFIEECKKHTEGGILWIRYPERNESVEPQFTFVSRGTPQWNAIPSVIPNFSELLQDYDPSKNALMYLSVAHLDKGSDYGQAVKVNYKT